MRQKTATGFTLIELLGAMFLSMLLMLAAMDVLRSLGRTDGLASGLSSAPGASVSALAGSAGATPGRNAAFTTAAPAVPSLLRWDLANARRFQIDAAGFTLWGMNSLDPADMSPTHRPTRVSYAIREFAGIPCLVRSEQPVTAAVEFGAAKNSSQIIESHISAISLAPLMDAVANDDESGGIPDPMFFERNAGRALTPRVQVNLTADNGTRTQAVLCLK